MIGVWIAVGVFFLLCGLVAKVVIDAYLPQEEPDKNYIPLIVWLISVALVVLVWRHWL